MPQDRTYHIRSVLNGQTLAAGLRGLDGKLSWNDARRLIQQRRVQINGNLALDDTRRLKTGDVVKIFDRALAAPPDEKDVEVLHIDADLIVVNKPPGITTLRHAEERDWDDGRKQKQPTLDEVIQKLLPTVWPPKSAALKPVVKSSPQPAKGVLRRGGTPTERSPAIGLPKVRAVHRLDRDTSGLMIFALSPRAETALVKLFKSHAIRRVYRAVVHGQLIGEQKYESWFVRDRGDGLRGSSPLGAQAPEAQHAVTEATPLEAIPGPTPYTLIECRLQTGRTHQIRIHLAEAGHMLCGEKTYLRPRPGEAAVHDRSDAPRQALHSAALEFEHPFTGKTTRFEVPFAPDLARWLERLKRGDQR